MTHVEVSQQYIKDVLSGKLPACNQIKQACERSKTLHSNPGEYYFDAKAANKVCKVLEFFPHVKGKWAAKNQTFKLSPWQTWITTELFGWKRKSDGLRKHRRATLIIPRKNGKTFWAAGIGLYMLLFDNESGAEVYCGASSQVQAKEVFTPARQIGLKVPELVSDMGLEVNASSLVVPATNSRFTTVIGTPKDGSSPHCAISDELHQQLSLEQWDSFLTGMGAREQPLAIAISTAGYSLENPCRTLQLEAEKVLAGIVQDDELFAAIYTIDPLVDWKSELALRMANPNIGVSVSLEFLQQAQQQAINTPSKANTFKTKHLDVTCSTSAGFFSTEKWLACGEDTNLESFAGQDCYIGIDLSSKLDICALSYVFPKQVDSRNHYYAFGAYFAPEETIANSSIYASWAANGYLIPTPGNTIDYSSLQAEIVHICNLCRVRSIAYDPYNADFFIQGITPLLPVDVEIVEVPQRATHLSVPMKLLEELHYNQRIHHDKNPVLAFAISNVIAKHFGNLVFPAKDKPENKIDPAVALMMALSRAANHSTAQTEIVMPFFI